MKGATEVLPFLLIDLAIIIVAARSFGALAKKMGQPAVIGEIVAGIMAAAILKRRRAAVDFDTPQARAASRTAAPHPRPVLGVADGAHPWV